MELGVILSFAISWALGALLAWLGFFCIRGRTSRAWLLIPALAIGMGFAPSLIASGGHFAALLPAVLAFFVSLGGGGEGLALSVISIAAVTLVAWFGLLMIDALRARRRKRFG